MKKILLTTVFCCAILIAFSQSGTGTIEMKQSFFGTTFTQNGKILKMKDLLSVMQPNETAYAYMKKARNKNTVGSIFGGVGGFLVGYTLGTAIGGKDPKWAVAGVGAGLIGAGVLFSVDAGKNAKRAVNTYNQSLQNSNAKTVKLEAIYAANGAGLRLSF